MYRALVVDSAEHLFANQGYERTGIQDIAAASGGGGASRCSGKT